MQKIAALDLETCVGYYKPMKFPESSYPWLESSTVFLTTVGSRAYGTNVENSDEDVKGFCVPPSGYYNGFLHKFEQFASTAPDLVIYDIRKFCRLAADCNPSVIETLYTAEKFHKVVTPVGRLLLDNRHLFLSRKAKHTFGGYALGQLKKMRAHKNFITNPPSPYNPTLSRDPEKLKVAKDVWESYQKWLKRDSDRKELEIKHGYDTKNAMHLVRLMRMGLEILLDKGCQVYRPDREELLAIRRGAWKYEDLVSWAEKAQLELEAAYSQSDLPETSPVELIDEVCQEAVELFVHRVDIHVQIEVETHMAFKTVTIDGYEVGENPDYTNREMLDVRWSDGQLCAQVERIYGIWFLRPPENGFEIRLPPSVVDGLCKYVYELDNPETKFDLSKMQPCDQLEMRYRLIAKPFSILASVGPTPIARMSVQARDCVEPITVYTGKVPLKTAATMLQVARFYDALHAP